MLSSAALRRSWLLSSVSQPAADCPSSLDFPLLSIRLELTSKLSMPRLRSSFSFSFFASKVTFFEPFSGMQIESRGLFRLSPSTLILRV